MKPYIFTLLLLLSAVGNSYAQDNVIPFADGHSVFTTRNAEESLLWKHELLKSAKKSIEMATGYAQGQVFQSTLDIFSEKLMTNPDIVIHLTISDASSFITEENRLFLELLATTFPGRFRYLCICNSGLLSQEGGFYRTSVHMKLIVVDEKYFMLGGTNLVDHMSRSNPEEAPPPANWEEEHLPKAVCDMDVVAMGPMAKKLRKEFFTLFSLFSTPGASLRNGDGPFTPPQDLCFPIKEDEKTAIPNFDGKHDLVKDVKAFALISGPRLQLHAIGNLYQQLINEARSTIHLGHMYFFPTPRIYEALLEAVNREVEISLITNTLHSRFTPSEFTIGLYADLSRSHYLPLMMGHPYSAFGWIQAENDSPKKSSIYEYNRDSVLYHKKTMTVDHRYAVLGSYNLGSKAENANFEIAIFFDAPLVAAQFDQLLEIDQAQAKKIEVSQARNWYFSIFHRVASWFQGTFFDGLILDTSEQGRP